MDRRFIKISLFAVLFLGINSLTVAQYDQNALLQQYLKTKAISPDRLSAFSNDTLALTRMYKNDSGAIRDSIRQETTLSVYEKITRGIVVDPDSLISSLEIFGYRTFKGMNAASILANNAPVSSSYPIGPGDEILITLWGRVNEEHRLIVDRNGMVNLPHFGPEAVTGQSFESMQQTLMAKMQSIDGVKASITMGKLRSIPIYIVGEVATPGMYMLSAFSGVTNALFACGGPSKMASLRSVSIIRGSRIVKTVDLYDFLLSGKTDAGLRLEPNDVIFVPIVKQMAAVTGNVRRSAIFEISKGATLKSLLDFAGGISPSGWTQKIQVERLKKNTFQTVLDVSGSPDGDIPSFELSDGDIVKVYPVIMINENVVFLTGNVQRAGKIELKPGMRLSDLLTGYDVFLPETYLAYSVIQRFDPPSYLARIIPFSIKNVLENPSSPDNVTLQSRDKIIIYNRDFFEPNRNVSIGGSITSPGIYKLLDNMRLKDLILQAGGLSDEASPDRGEIYRRLITPQNTVSTKKIEFCTRCAMEDDVENNILIEKSDQIFIRKKEGWQETRRVHLGGEFVFPGDYVIFENEQLGALIKRAGGFTPEAYVTAAVLTRVSVKMSESKRIDEYTRQLETDATRFSAELAAKDKLAEAQMVLAQQTQLVAKLRQVSPEGRVVIDLTDPQSFESFLLEDGDALIIPKKSNTVSVIGEVYNPATFRYTVEAPQAIRYINQSGGFKVTADKNNSYIIKANGTVISHEMANVFDYRLEPGDAVIIPQRIEFVDPQKAFSDALDMIAKVATIAAGVLTTIVLVNSLNK